MVRVLRAELTAHAHATEDVERVRRALLELVPPELRGQARVEEVTVAGHYSNPIVRLAAVFEGEDAVKVLEYIGGRLGEAEKRVLEASLENRYDEREGRLYIRFSKQDAFLGRLRVYDGDDVVRLVVVFRGTPRLTRVVEELRRIGLLP